MPIVNELNLYCTNTDKLLEFLNHIQSEKYDFDFSKLIPRKQNTLQWEIDNWGSAQPDQLYVESMDPNYAMISFISYDTIPKQIYEAIHEQFPEIDCFAIYCSNLNEDMCGSIEWESNFPDIKYTKYNGYERAILIEEIYGREVSLTEE